MTSEGRGILSPVRLPVPPLQLISETIPDTNQQPHREAAGNILNGPERGRMRILGVFWLLAYSALAQVNVIPLHQFQNQFAAASGVTQVTGGDYVGGLVSPSRIFRMTPNGQVSMLYTFSADGSQCVGPNTLVQGSDGKLYGTCSGGGSSGNGTAFVLTLGGQFTLLYSFQGSDGRNPAGKLVEGDDGNFYGVTQFGGPNDAGTIFRISPAGQFTPLFAFDGTNGYNVNGGLILASDGNFYGTTYAGGPDLGSVFQISPAGVFSTVYFMDGFDGYSPNGPVIQRSDGNFYGTTLFGGAFDFGVVYRLTPGGGYSVLASFDDFTNGADPFGPLVDGSDGNLYGSTTLEYYYLGGTEFRLTPAGQLTTLVGWGQGDQLAGQLGQAEGGGIRGLTDDGLVFAFRLALPEPKPSINGFQPVSGAVGKVIKIRGDHFVYASNVQFNGVKAAFRTTSSNYILAVVPGGATSGPITVTNLGGTATSAGNFTVLP
jgi:uncharacterized repeat protein (TIGR03803 family)